MNKVLVPLALALAVTASGAAFAKTNHMTLNTDPSSTTARHVSADTSSMTAMSDRSGMASQNGQKIVWKKHHNTFLSDNGLFGPYGPE